ncbi:MAG TPA: NlpC/P60 family protein [Acidimicrobiia bacterium]|nr:NlpC/P60 family protein [Acidimicrobiia bacterium]
MPDSSHIRIYRAFRPVHRSVDGLLFVTLFTRITPASANAPVRGPRARCVRWLAALALVVALVPIVSGGRAHGDPIDDKRAEAKSLQDQIDAGGAQLDALSERYNGAQYRLEQAEAAAADAQQKLDAAQAEVARLSDLVKQRAAALYRGVGQGGPVDLDVSSASRLISSSKYSKSAAQHDIDLVKQLRSAQRALQDQKAAAEQAQADARDEQAQIGQAQAAVEAANARQEQLLSQVNGEIAQLVAEEQARREAAALAEAQQRYAAAAAAASAPSGGPAPAPSGAPAPAPSRSSGGSGPVNPNVPVNGGGAAAAIAYARAQLGKPYCYAGAGPACFDCSGLTMRAWGAAGVNMPHYSGAQYSMFPHVPLNAMQPGDLVFWGPGGSEHVGLYIGGGQMIAAPHTGDVVKIQAVYGSPVGAARPG